MSFTDAEKAAVTSGRVDFYGSDGTTKLLDFSVATEYQKTGQPTGESWTDWVERLNEEGHLNIRIWEEGRF